MRRQSMNMSAAAAIVSILCVLPTQQCNAGWVDPDTPEENLRTISHFSEDTRKFELVRLVLRSINLLYFWVDTIPDDHVFNIFSSQQVFSDEFEQDGRSFEDGADPRWTAIDKNDCE